MSTSPRYRRSEDVAFRQVGEECLLVPIRTSPSQDMSVFALNPVGAFLWVSLEQPRSVDDLSGQLVQEFEVGREQAARDVQAFVERLLSRALVAEVEA
jgi:hypothetical protein